jgi:hypothetical protein
MPDGKVIYSDAPEKGAVKVEKSKPDTSKKGITAATPNEPPRCEGWKANA